MHAGWGQRRRAVARGKLPARLFGFLRFQSRALGPGVGLSDNPRATGNDPSPRRPSSHSLPPPAVPPPPFKAGSLPLDPGARVGDGDGFGGSHPAGPAHLPYLEWGSLLCRRAHSERRRGEGCQGRGALLPIFQLSLLPPHPKSASDVSRPEQGGPEWRGGGGVGSGLCPDTCLPRRPGPAGVWREGGSLPPAPHNPHVSKGG